MKCMRCLKCCPPHTPPPNPNLLSNFSWAYRYRAFGVFGKFEGGLPIAKSIKNRLGAESKREIVSFRFIRAWVRAAWLPSGIRSQKCAPSFSLVPFAPLSFPFSLVYKVYNMHKAYKLCKVSLPPPPNNMHGVYKLCRVLPPPPKPPSQH